MAAINKKLGATNMTGYTPYTGTFDSEYKTAWGRAQTEMGQLNSQLDGLRQTDEAGLNQQRDYATGQLAKNLTSAQRGNYRDYVGQQRVLQNRNRVMGATGGGAQRMNAQLGQAYTQARTSARASHDSSLSDVNQQWQTGKNDIASRYGEMRYNNMRDAFTNANSNAWNAYNSGMSRDADLWGRQNTTTYQAQQQANADRDYEFARGQWESNKAYQQQVLDLQKKQLLL